MVPPSGLIKGLIGFVKHQETMKVTPKRQSPLHTDLKVVQQHKI
jgi:hypothetical protein